VTYSTPGPSGNPDYYTTPTQAGTQLLNMSGSTSTSVTLPSFYVGNTSAITIFAQMIPATDEWNLQVNWSLTEVSTGSTLQSSYYYGDDTVVVVDSVLVQGPWCSLVVQSNSGTLLTYEIIVSSSFATARASAPVLSQYPPIATTTSCPASATTRLPARYLAPGLYTWEFDCTAALTGEFILAGTYGQTFYGRMAGQANPAASTYYSGQVVVMGIEPCFFVVNNGAAPVTVNANLIGPA
jgi:hypothetical protein